MGRGRRLLAVTRALWEQSVDLVFPPECTACGKEGAWVCSSCKRSLVRHQNLQCPSCGHAFWRGFFCRRCSSGSYLIQCVAAFRYADKGVARMVKALKYDSVTKSAPALASFMVSAWNDTGGTRSGVCIPISLHPLRKKERGYNQAELLARFCASGIGLSYSDDILVRVRHTPPQTERSRQDRKANILDAFSCKKPDALKGLDVVLIDDVYTTGATLQEAARVLKESGAREVRALTLAHG